MKKTLFYCAAVLFFALTITNIIQAQNSTSTTKLNVKITPENIFLAERLSGSIETKELRKNEINIRAQRDFIKEYESVTDARWYISGNGLLAVYFTKAGITTRRYYNKKGLYEYMMRYYNEDKLNHDVRHLVKSKYYDFSIFQVIEEHKNGSIAFLIEIQDKDSWKTIKVVDNEMEVVDEMQKTD